LTQPPEEDAEPVCPELPESPEFDEEATPAEEASPVWPESALPEESLVELPEEVMAGPLSPPWVPDSAVELPVAPEEEVVTGSEVADPVSPEVEWPEEDAEEVVVGGSTSISETAWGLDSEEPESPEALEESLVEEAPPLEPVSPEVVVESVEESPDLAEDEELEVEDTAPEVPPAPESPEVEEGSAVAEPEEAEPVEPLVPLAATSDPSQLAS
jgi:hypothetical protein